MAAAKKVALVHHVAATVLFDMLARRVRDYVGLCGTGSTMSACAAPAALRSSGAARTKLEQMLPADGFLERLLAPTDGRVIGAEDITEIFLPI
jgi:TRAP-type C4-dicarboxylate transport system permease small subunit